MVDSAYIAVALVGLLHGLEPGHGWPIATIYATRSSHPLFRGFISSWVISMAHLISSVAVVVPFVLLKTYAGFTLPYVNIIAGFAMILLSFKMLLEKKGEEAQHYHLHEDFEGEHEHEHVHPDGSKHSHKHKHAEKVALTLSSIAVFALILGFAHDEEFMLLSLAVAGVDPLLLMITYSLAVMTGLIGVSMVAIRIYKVFEPKFKRYEHLLPKISGLILLVLGITLLLGLR
ncbi:MAG: nickel/cobalt transporter [Thaumarchaeota archaeon]|nr:nickel/cobalt transporter [Nitrososphaerota archaeon]MCL5318133.1 nickel/cobalt transporter [Nitrososphaerota archaeon]